MLIYSSIITRHWLGLTWTGSDVYSPVIVSCSWRDSIVAMERMKKPAVRNKHEDIN